jgi:peptide chain release factor 1
MIDKLRELKKEYDSLAQELAVRGSQSEEYQKRARRIRELAPIITRFDELLEVEKQIRDAEEILREQEEGDLSELAREELSEGNKRLEAIKKELSSLLTARGKEPGTGQAKGVIVEIRAGAGGEEAALFARDLFEMYSRFAENKGWKTEPMDCHHSEMGGLKEVIFGLEGRDTYALMRHEGGVHRVQRIPQTESSGRIHTSTVTVAVLPEMEEIQVNVDLKDLRIDTFRASGAGGQHVNVTDSAIRITHLPTGITVQCQDERSQHKNRAKAMRVLQARLADHLREEKEKEIAKDRNAQVKTGDRSEKIRTYNFPQNRVTDHRINLTLHKLESIMKGDLEKLFAALKEAS